MTIFSDLLGSLHKNTKHLVIITILIIKKQNLKKINKKETRITILWKIDDQICDTAQYMESASAAIAAGNYYI